LSLSALIDDPLINWIWRSILFSRFVYTFTVYFFHQGRVPDVFAKFLLFKCQQYFSSFVYYQNGVDQSWEDVFSILNEQDVLAFGSQQPPSTVDDHSSISSFIQLPAVGYIDDPSIVFNQELLLPMTLQPSSSFQQDPLGTFQQAPVPSLYPDQTTLYNQSRDHFDHNPTFNNQVALFPSFNETTPMNQHEMSTLPIGRQFVPDMTSYHYQPMSAALVQNVSMAVAVPMITDELTMLNSMCVCYILIVLLGHFTDELKLLQFYFFEYFCKKTD